MIFDDINGLGKYINAIPQLKRIIELLDSGEIYNLPAGSYPTDTEGLRFMINEYIPNMENDNKHEYHGKEIDVQVMIKGKEKCTYSSLGGDISLIDYSKGDIAFVVTEPEEECILSEGKVVIYFPGELHKPGIGIDSEVQNRKIVFKVIWNNLQ